MKVTVTISVENDIYGRFLGVCGVEGIDKNRTIEYLMQELIEKKTTKMIVCKKCNASYTSKLSECPQCKIERNQLSKKNELKELQERRKKLAGWKKEGKAKQSEIDIVDVEIEALKKDIKGVV